jgi:hypothetical protein
LGKVIHELVAGFGGTIYIMVGVERQRERRLVMLSGKKAEGPAFWNLLILAGVCLLVFSFGLMIYQMSPDQI